MTWLPTIDPMQGAVTLIDTVPSAPNWSAGDVVKFSRINKGASSYVGDGNVSLNASTGRISLPNKPCLLYGAVSYYIGQNTGGTATYLTLQWYDVTNATYIGSKGIAWSYRLDFYFALRTQQADEQAVALVDQGQDVELHVVSPVNKGPFTIQGDVVLPRHSKSRAIIMELN
jgi:hypothetical protein